MPNFRTAFSMMEMVFVIVILGILYAIAAPRLSASRTDAHIAKGKADIASIRSGIVSERQSRLIRGNSDFIATDVLDTNTTTGLFDGVLMYAVVPTATKTNGHWSFVSAPDLNTSNYTYGVSSSNIAFQYTRNDGLFLCTVDKSDAGILCGQLSN